jgi:hypothetical protein
MVSNHQAGPKTFLYNRVANKANWKILFEKCSWHFLGQQLEFKVLKGFC